MFIELTLGNTADRDIKSQHIEMSLIESDMFAAFYTGFIEREGMLWQKMMNEAGNNLPVANPCYSLAVFHDGDYKENDVDVEIQTAVVSAM